MKRYLEGMDKALRDSDHHTALAFNVPDWYPPELRRTRRRDLQEAARLSGDTIYGKRVAMYRMIFDALEEFCAMRRHRNAFQFEQARAAHERLRAIQEEAIAQDPPYISSRGGRSYMRRFWTPAVEQGYQRTTGGNELVAGLPDQWDFLLDSAGVGKSLRYYRRDLTGGNWQKLPTKTATWSDLGLRHYEGDAWYRTSVVVPARFEGRKIMLWFGGVDDMAEVWVNGQRLGEVYARQYKPFELDVTAAVRPGEENVVAVRINNEHTWAIETGGIIAPVMFWSPKPQDQ
jgi:hypothetical protein